MIITPPSDGTSWSFSIDIDADAQTDFQGILEDPTSFNYVFDDPGLHRILLTFSRNSQTRRDTLYVSVNDPSIIVARTYRGNLPVARGLAYANQFLYLTDDDAIEQRDPLSFDLIARLQALDSIPKDLQGLSLGLNGLLYAANVRRPEVLEIRVPDLEHLRALPASRVGRVFVDASTTPGRLYVGGNGEIEIVDLTNGNTIAERRVVGGGHFAVAKDSQKIALIQYDPTRIHILDVNTLESQFTFDVAGFRPEVLAFNDDSDVLYILGLSEDALIRFIALNVSARDVIRDLTLDSCTITCFSFIEGNPTAVIPGFSVIATESGALLIDHLLHLPTYRLPVIPSLLMTCCTVTAGETNRALYFGGYDGSLSSILLSFPDS